MSMPYLSPVPDRPPDDDDPSQGSVDGAESGDPPDKAPAKGRVRTSHPLPSDRVARDRQLEILRAFAVAAADNGGSASNVHVGKLVRMSHNTVALVTPFLVDSGLLVRADRGRLRPTEAVTEYSRAYSWTPNQAGHHLAPIAGRSWFGQVILPRVSVSARSEDEILAALSSASGAGTEHRQQLLAVIDYATVAGIIERNGDQLRAGQMSGRGAVATPEVPGPEVPAAAGTSGPGVQTRYVQDPNEGYVEFHVDVKVRTSEFSTWRPERISAFFGGIAQVLAAKGRMEADDSDPG